MGGWKEPATHFILHHLLSHYPCGRYIHVLRHGLDMAISNNLNQVDRFGPLFGLEDSSPASALKFWLSANTTDFERMSAHPGRQ